MSTTEGQGTAMSPAAQRMLDAVASTFEEVHLEPVKVEIRWADEQATSTTLTADVRSDVTMTFDADLFATTATRLGLRPDDELVAQFVAVAAQRALLDERAREIRDVAAAASVGDDDAGDDSGTDEWEADDEDAPLVVWLLVESTEWIEGYATEAGARAALKRRRAEADAERRPVEHAEIFPVAVRP